MTTTGKITTKINTLGLGEQLTQMEGKASPFENLARHLPLHVMHSFKFPEVGACTFSYGSLSLHSERPDVVSQKLPTLMGQQAGQILESTGEKLSVSGKRVAVLFSGGPASGGHNVLVGLKAALGENNTLLGIKAGPKGLLAGDLFEITSADISRIQNLGGFDFLGSDRTKIKTKEQLDLVKSVVLKHQLDGLIIVGGDDSNTNAAFLAEHLAPFGCSVVGVPKTIDGDLQAGSYLPISFGFDTATKIYAELVGNILQDTPSSRKYWHFVKLMGRSASHVALEVALQTKPQLTLISEEISQNRWTLNQVVTQIAKTILRRAAQGLHYGVVLIPEGVIEFIPELNDLIQSLNLLLAQHADALSILDRDEQISFILTQLTQSQAALLDSLPDVIRTQLLLERDSHGNLQVSQIPTEQLLVDMVKVRIKELRANPDAWGEWTPKEIEKMEKFKFAVNHHFFGYEGRCGAPSRFDASYTFNLGLIAGSLALGGHTGYMAALGHFNGGGKAYGLPLSGLMGVESRSGEDTLVIRKALVDLSSPAFGYFASRRDQWALKDLFCNPGPIQLWGPASMTVPLVVALNQGLPSLIFDIGDETLLK
jgi:pyrophosphate--fructose-6-phosphate 1-phosphotransferase